ncbi:hypothetical protein [Enterococcus diestrammenae]|uniref:Uncharacterized protein n=1 Tax=Enterococcus diestrammenae TaxID=1155073 RepID=A0ABV0F0X7_9ENTE|nr:hypothetical protein [Enterococcus diestrammenae]
MFMTLITLFSLLSLLVILGVSAFAVVQYISAENQMEKVPVRIKDDCERRH